MMLLTFRKNTAGTAILEFAVVAPILFLLLVGFIELGLILFTQSALEGATNFGSRIGKTGFSSGTMSREDYIRQRIDELSGGFLDISRLTIEILSYDTLNNIGQPEPCIIPPNPPCGGTPGVNFVDINGNGTFDMDQGRASAGGGGSVVLYRVTYPWTLFTPIMSSLAGNNGVLDITAISAVRNEPF